MANLVKEKPRISQVEIPTPAQVPGVRMAYPPRFNNVLVGLERAAPSRFKNLPVDHIMELPRGVLTQAKAKLKSLRVPDLAEVGNLTLTSTININRAGLIAPRRFMESVLVKNKVLPNSTTFVRGPASPFPWTYAVNPAWRQNESVLIADELDLRNKTMIIDRDKVSHLWIIARKIKATPGANITYSPKGNPNYGQTGVAGNPNPGRPNYDPRASQSSTGGRANNGGSGAHGSDGGSGPVGKDAPDLTICVLEIDAMPNIMLPGQNGGKGGRGGRGARGGNGQRGRDSKTGWVKRSGLYRWGCKWDAGYGGHGGSGGNGGRGGRGGRGGQGGNIKIATQEDQLNDAITHSRFIIDIGGGEGGNPGVQGTPGEGGQGGIAGRHRGWPCTPKGERIGQKGRQGRRMGTYGRGDKGSPGMLGYEIVTKAEWELLLEKPWITSLSKSAAFAGEEITVNGFHFVERSYVYLDSQRVTTEFVDYETLTFVVPQNTSGGEHRIRVRTSDGDWSEDVPLRIRPKLIELRKGNQPTNRVVAGDTIDLMGRSFVNGAGLYMNGMAMEIKNLIANKLTFDIPEVLGADNGGKMELVLRNPDGLRSNVIKIERLPSLDGGFRAKPNGYAFENYSKGGGDWETFIEVFGRSEIAGSLILHPVLTGIYYGFFKWYLENNGHCTGISALTLRDFHFGITDNFDKTPSSADDPPPIPSDLYMDIDCAQGRLLSRELLTHYADQGQEGVDRVERTIREIENDFSDNTHLNANTARILCFIPKGNVWDAITDEGYREAFANSHTVVPTRLVYPNKEKSLDGAKLYIYDNNYPGDDFKCIDLFKKNGKIHFNYTPRLGYNISSTGDFTLGTASLRDHLFKDVDLPFSGISGLVSVGSFITDLIMSPAYISIEDETGKKLGYKGGKIYADPELGYVCPWLENLVLIKEEKEVSRKIIGKGEGTYTYATISPKGKSLLIKEAKCSSATRDRLDIDKNFTKVDITTNETKTFDLHIGERLEDESVRYLNIKYEMNKDDQSQLMMAPGLEGVKLNTPERKVNVEIKSYLFDGVNLVEENSMGVEVPRGKSLELPAKLWTDMKAVDLKIIPRF